MKKKAILLSIILFSLGFSASLWKESSESPFLRKTNFKIGDTITIIIDESLSALQSGSTKSDKSSDTDLSMDNRQDKNSSIGGRKVRDSISDTLKLGVGGKGRFSGSGSTQRQSSIKTTITATVIDVQPNGNLFILGQRQIKVHDEVEQFEISGIVRIEDITDNNSVYSTKIANAKIAIKGAGVVSDQQKPGVMLKLFDWLF